MGDPIATAAEAISRADALTRLDTVSGPPVAALVKVTDDVTAFLGEANVGKAAWRVVYPKSSLKFPSATPGFADAFQRTFTVMLEAASGRLFFLSSTYEGERDPDMRPMPWCGEAAE